MTSSPDITPEVSLFANEGSAAIPHPFTLNVELTYPAGLRPDRDAMLDHLLRNQGPGGSPPFTLVEVNGEILSSNDSKIVHEKLSFKLEPHLAGSFGLAFLQIPFVSDNPNVPPTSVLSPLIYLEVTLPKPPTIDMASEVAPLANLSSREPIELESGIRSSIMRDESAWPR